ncbi:hypothetical protein [Anatilimnocola floriformis]|uniref:hypothetical protein n=1 Tax=Anatilimnocola floriformis TaxID=2948575 RepID=UPI0020C264F3|nr:hypothetical protein [Anatilimnocola floriformis]
MTPSLEHAIESFLAITSLVIGLSHLLRPHDWCETFRQLHRCGRSGAFINGGLSLIPGAIIAGHGSWSWPGSIVTTFGWLLILKACVCFLRPDLALSSMEKGSQSPRGFIFAGLLMLVFSGWVWYCLWIAANQRGYEMSCL